MKLWRWFYGHPTNPYSPVEPGPKWYPDILTPRWWRWCLKHGWNGLARERIRMYYIRNIKRQLRRPLCWVRGHQSYDSSSWGYTAKKCSRCSKTLFYYRYPQPPRHKRVTI